ncbi:DUF2785 domain-containing protein [Lysinibacillus fusiformis]|uniref:DUF2785 domain-containing protein n=1 Tax=Lysinibacillus fusiformis TaxID=28031 RepID=UPI0037F908FB
MDTRKNLLDHRCLTKLWHYCLDHLLLNGIEEEESDEVFTRSFTTLLVAFILARDGRIVWHMYQMRWMNL